MNRSEFMKALEQLLSDLPSSEREEALQFYEDYFDDAGPEKEQQVLESLGSPQKVAAIIREGLSDKEGNAGEFTENGYHTQQEQSQRDELGTRNVQSSKITTGMIILLVILGVFALPVLGSVGTGIVAAVFGIIVAAFAIIFAIAITGAALCLSAAAVFVGAVVAVFTEPLAAVCLAGVSFILAGIGILLLILGIWIVVKVIPVVIRFIVRVCRKPFEKREGGAK